MNPVNDAGMAPRERLVAILPCNDLDASGARPWSGSAGRAGRPIANRGRSGYSRAMRQSPLSVTGLATSPGCWSPA